MQGFGGVIRFCALLMMALAVSVAPASAHKKHPKQAAAEIEATAQLPPDGNAADPAPGGKIAVSTHSSMAESMGDVGDRAPMPPLVRFLDWLGRLHPVIVHFPIAFFPAALFTAIVGRRRAAFGKPVQFLVIAGGIIAPIAAILGWLDAMSADPDPLLTVHRWLGTAIGIGGFSLAAWAWRKPGQDRGTAMIAGLAVITVAIVVQGWYGGALVHGIDHLDW